MAIDKYDQIIKEKPDKSNDAVNIHSTTSYKDNNNSNSNNFSFA